MRKQKKFNMKDAFEKIRSSKKRMILSVVALVEIIMLLVVSTYAWVETVSTIRIYTGSDGNASATGTINSKSYQKANITPSTGSAIDLAKMYHEAGDVHLAPASSSDGRNIFFPSANNGTTKNYRLATTSDNMVNFVSFSFTVNTATTFLFDAQPTFQFGTTSLSNSLVRVSFSVYNPSNSNLSTVIYSKAATTAAVVNSTSGSTAATNVRDIDNYAANGVSGFAFRTTGSNQVVTVRIWIQDPSFASTSTYLGKKLQISNFKLVPAYSVTSTVSVNGTAATSASSVGTTKTGSSTASYTSTAYYKYGATSTSMTATLSDNDYVFAGWGTTANTTSYASTSTTYNYTTAITGNITRYAIFRQKVALTAKAVLSTGTTASSTYGTVQVGDNTSGASSTGNYVVGSTVTLKASAATNYTFIGWFKDTNSAADSAALSTSTSYQVTVSAAATYYARFRSNPTITAQVALGESPATVTTYGTVKVGSATAGYTSSARVSYNGSVTLTATPTSSYSIVGWYKGTPSSSTFVEGSNGSSTLTVSNVTANATYYCSFKQKSTVTIYAIDRGYGTSSTYAYIYDSNGNALAGAWPGTRMTWNNNNTGLFSISFTTAETGNFYVTLNNGSGTQYPASGTNGLSGTISDGASYLFQKSSMTSWTLGTNRFRYFTNNYSWSTVKCYRNGGSSNNEAWASSPTMTQMYTNEYSQNVYYIQINTHNLIIFHNGSGSQTVDIKDDMLRDNARYYISGSSGGKYTVAAW